MRTEYSANAAMADYASARQSHAYRAPAPSTRPSFAHAFARFGLVVAACTGCAYAIAQTLAV